MTSTRREYLKRSSVVTLGGLVGLSGCIGNQEQTGDSGAGSGETTTGSGETTTGSGETTSNSEQIVLKHNSGGQPGTLDGDVAVKFKSRVESRLDSVKVENYFNNQLGGVSESVEGISNGTIDLYIIGFPNLEGLYSDIALLSAPYLYEDYDDLLQTTDPRQSGKASELYQNLAEETNIRTLGVGVVGTRRLTLSGEPAHQPSDLNGRKVRSVPYKLYTQTVAGLGAEPTEVAWSELPTALATGAVSGQENPYNFIVDYNLYEGQDYVVETDHMDMPLPLFIHEGKWQKMTDHQQEVIQDVAVGVMEETVPMVEDSIEEDKQAIRDAGLEIIPNDEIEMEKFQTSVRETIREVYSDRKVEIIEGLHNGDYQ